MEHGDSCYFCFLMADVSPGHKNFPALKNNRPGRMCIQWRATQSSCLPHQVSDISKQEEMILSELSLHMFPTEKLKPPSPTSPWKQYLEWKVHLISNNNNNSQKNLIQGLIHWPDLNPSLFPPPDTSSLAAWEESISFSAFVWNRHPLCPRKRSPVGNKHQNQTNRSKIDLDVWRLGRRSCHSPTQCP